MRTPSQKKFYALKRRVKELNIWRYMRHIAFPYFLIFPAIICLSLVIFYPLLQVFKMSFYEIEPMYSKEAIFCGFRNFQEVLTNPEFLGVLGQTACWVFGSALLQFVIGLVTALLLDAKIRGRGLSRSLLLIPWAMPSVVGALAWKWIYHGQYGLMNHMLCSINLLGKNINWLGNAKTAMISCILTNSWRGFPFIMLMLLAGLQNIPHELQEVAAIDGASKFQTFTRVILPLLKPVIMVATLLSSIWTFNNFTYIYILTGGGPAGKTDILVTYIYKQGFEFFHFGYASALSVILFLIVFIFSLAYIRLMRIEELEML